MKKVCYIIEMNSSLCGLLERLEDLGAYWNLSSLRNGMMEITITVREDRIVAVQDEIAFYV